jgi:aspartyl-tRNA synthetase
MGKITFIDLSDNDATIQCVYFSKGNEVSRNDYLEIIGFIKKRSEKNFNSNEILGEIELDVESVTKLSKSTNMPIPTDTDGYEVNEDTRLRYRYLDLRRERLNRNLRLRSRLVHQLRQYLIEKDFIEVETPYLTKATMEGARNFIVPSRLNKGSYYALPQSPQQYKQLLMCSDINRYFQFAKCFRDEDLRADRGFEFTQLDLEMSYVKEADVMGTIEGMIKESLKQFDCELRLDGEGNFPVFDYKDAIKKFGADKFDLRQGKDKDNSKVLAFAWVVRFPFFKKVDKLDEAEVMDGKSGWTFTHNPFSRPIDECVDDHMNGKNIGGIYTTQYDLVCNGYEIGGGSIRAHTPEMLKATYKIMGYTDEEIEALVGHMIEAFESGCPPHGGIALGMDRLSMLIAGEKSLKEVIAFPMTASGKTAVMDAPGRLPKKDLKIYAE